MFGFAIWDVRRRLLFVVGDHLGIKPLFRRRGLFNLPPVEKLLSEHEKGFADRGSLLWALLSVEMWQRLFIDSVPRPQRF